MKWKKTLSVLICGIVTVSLFTGCGNSNSSNPLKETHLKIFIPQPRFKDQYTKYFDQFAAKYQKEKGVKVTYDLEMPDPNNATQILKTRLAAKEDLDIFTINAVSEIPTYSKAGYLEDLSDQAFTGKLLDSVKPLVSYDSKVVGVPLESLAWGYLYSKKTFKDLGLSVPTTLTEMKTVVEKLKAAKVTPFLLTYKDAWIAQLVLPLTFGAYLNTSNKDLLDKMNKGTGSLKEISGMFDIIDLVNSNGTNRGMDVGGDDGCAEFAQGKAAMWVQGPWYAESIKAVNKDFDFGVAPLPVNDDPNATMINLSVSTTMVLSKYSKNKDVSKALLNYMLDDNDSNAFYQSMSFNPVSKNHTFIPYPWVQDAMTYVKQNKSYQDPAIPQAVKDEVGKVLQSYYLKSVTKDDVIKDLDKTWMDSVKQ